ncbi:MAG: hypothetical protein M3P18_01020 [Actinomycetota bacterium]|nr:hypothetical protein [Actinomycetota bacterium]
MKRNPVVAALAVGLIVAAALGVGPGVAVGSVGSQGTLLMLSNHPTNGSLRVSLVDVASGTKRIVLQGDIVGAAWSPDGKWIAVSKDGYVMLLRGDGRDLRRLPLLSARPASTYISDPSFAWAPNSHSLAINEAGGHRLVIRRIDGGVRVIRRTGSDAAMFRLSWSPDGRWISYDREGRFSMSIHLIHPDGSGDHTAVVIHDSVPNNSPSPALWAPGGHRFAYTTESSDARDPPLGVVDTDSGKVAALAMPNALPIGWSADESEFAAVQRGLNGQPGSLLLIDASGQSRALLMALAPSGLAGAWSPDGKKLAVSGTDHQGAFDIELVDPVGGPPRVVAQLPHDSPVQLLTWRPHAQTP